ncbi:MAG: retropepsin-like aspartic protease [Paludibacteraceae bacterium]
MSKNKVVIYLFFLLLFNSVYSVNYDQELANLLAAKKWFDVEKYYQAHRDSIHNDFVLLWYKAETGRVFNKPQQAIEAYEKIIDINPKSSFNSANLISFFGQPLLNLYWDKMDFHKGIETGNKLIEITKKDTTIDNNYRQAMITSLENNVIKSFGQEKEKNRQKTYLKEIENTNNKEIELIRGEDNNGLFVTSLWNNKPLKSLFDTGAGSCYIYNKDIANKISLKLNEKDTIYVNNNTIKAISGIVDSVEIGIYKFRNVPVTINVEKIDRNDSAQVRCDSLLSKEFDVIIGLPLMKELGQMMFDFSKKTMTFFPDSIKDRVDNRNMYIENNGLFLET